MLTTYSVHCQRSRQRRIHRHIRHRHPRLQDDDVPQLNLGVVSELSVHLQLAVLVLERDVRRRGLYDCFRPLLYYDRNLHVLPNGKRLPLKLDVIFPLLFPRHALIGKNHRALVDAQQLRLVDDEARGVLLRQKVFAAESVQHEANGD